MVIGDLDWIIKLGSITRTNHASSPTQSEEGALEQVKEDVKVIMEQAKSLVPLFLKCVASDEGEPVVKEEIPVPEVISFELPNGSWFSIAGSKVFGFKLVGKKEKDSD